MPFRLASRLEPSFMGKIMMEQQASYGMACSTEICSFPMLSAHSLGSFINIAS